MKKFSLRAAISSMLLLVCVPAIGFEKYAVIVGVNDYPQLPKELWLTGSVNDALLMTNVAQANGFSRSNIRLLANADEADALPDKRNIVAALNSVASKAKAGDFVFVHMAGHGSQQPAVNDASEIDGWDETFLPRDVRYWDGDRKVLPNALTDNEFASLFDNIRAQGANLWVVFDSCHSGTITRSGFRMRAINPSTLGIPAGSAPRLNLDESRQVRGSIKNRAFTENGVEELLGNLVVFSAAGSHQQTPELGIEVNGKSVIHGLFTYSLARALALGTALTYADLSENILQAYVEHDWEYSFPVISGTALNSPAFEFSTRTDMGWSISQNKQGLLNIDAGYLQGLEAGDVIGIYDRMQADKLLFWSELIDVKATRSIARPLAKALVEPEMFALPIRESDADKVLSVALLDSVSEVMDVERLINIPWLDINADTATDISIHLADQRLWFIKRGQFMPCLDANSPCRQNEQYLTLRVTRGTQIAELVLLGLHKLWQVRQVLQMPAIIDDNNHFQGPDITLQVKSSGDDRFAAPEQRELVLSSGDEIRLLVTNDTRQPYDVTLMFIGSDLSVTQLYPAPGESARIRPGQELPWEGVANDASTGREQIVALVIPATPGMAEPDLSYLQQAPFDLETRASTRVAIPSQEPGARSTAVGRLFTWTMEGK